MTNHCNTVFSKVIPEDAVLMHGLMDVTTGSANEGIPFADLMTTACVVTNIVLGVLHASYFVVRGTTSLLVRTLMLSPIKAAKLFARDMRQAVQIIGFISLATISLIPGLFFPSFVYGESASQIEEREKSAPKKSNKKDLIPKGRKKSPESHGSDVAKRAQRQSETRDEATDFNALNQTFNGFTLGDEGSDEELEPSPIARTHSAQELAKPLDCSLNRGFFPRSTFHHKRAEVISLRPEFEKELEKLRKEARERKESTEPSSQNGSTLPSGGSSPNHSLDDRDSLHGDSVLSGEGAGGESGSKNDSTLLLKGIGRKSSVDDPNSFHEESAIECSSNTSHHSSSNSIGRDNTHFDGDKLQVEDTLANAIPVCSRPGTPDSNSDSDRGAPRLSHDELESRSQHQASGIARDAANTALSLISSGALSTGETAEDIKALTLSQGLDENAQPTLELRHVTTNRSYGLYDYFIPSHGQTKVLQFRHYLLQMKSHLQEMFPTLFTQLREQIEEKAVKKGWIYTGEETFYLNLKELIDLLDGPGAIGNPTSLYYNFAMKFRAVIDSNYYVGNGGGADQFSLIKPVISAIAKWRFSGISLYNYMESLVEEVTGPLSEAITLETIADELQARQKRMKDTSPENGQTVIGTAAQRFCGTAGIGFDPCSDVNVPFSRHVHTLVKGNEKREVECVRHGTPTKEGFGAVSGVAAVTQDYIEHIKVAGSESRNIMHVIHERTVPEGFEDESRRAKAKLALQEHSNYFPIALPMDGPLFKRTEAEYADSSFEKFKVLLTLSMMGGGKDGARFVVPDKIKGSEEEWRKFVERTLKEVHEIFFDNKPELAEGKEEWQAFIMLFYAHLKHKLKIKHNISETKSICKDCIDRGNISLTIEEFYYLIMLGKEEDSELLKELSVHTLAPPFMVKKKGILTGRLEFFLGVLDVVKKMGAEQKEKLRGYTFMGWKMDDFSYPKVAGQSAKMTKETVFTLQDLKDYFRNLFGETTNIAEKIADSTLMNRLNLDDVNFDPTKVYIGKTLVTKENKGDLLKELSDEQRKTLSQGAYEAGVEIFREAFSFPNLICNIIEDSQGENVMQIDKVENVTYVTRTFDLKNNEGDVLAKFNVMSKIMHDPSSSDSNHHWKILEQHIL